MRAFGGATKKHLLYGLNPVLNLTKSNKTLPRQIAEGFAVYITKKYVVFPL